MTTDSRNKKPANVEITLCGIDMNVACVEISQDSARRS